MQNGALPTETCRAILSYKGVLIKKHLLEGVKKGAFDDAEATKRFEEWMKQNDAKVESKKSGLEKSRDDEVVNKLAAEKKVNEARAAKLAKKLADLAAKAEAADKAEAVAEEQVPAAEAPVATEAPEAPVASEAPVATEAPEAPASEKTPEAAAEEKPQE
jgi:small subunit ribosomal protein S16